MAHRTHAWLTGLVLVVWSAPSLAGNDDGVLLGNEAAVVAGAVTATVSDGSALWYNPARLTEASTDTIDVSASAFVIRRYQAENWLAAADGSHSGVSMTEVISVPSSLSYVRRVWPNLTIGYGVFVPSAHDNLLRTSFETSDPILYRIQLISTSRESSYRAGAGFGWKPLPQFRFGGGLFVSYDTASDLTYIGMSAQPGPSEPVVLSHSETTLSEHSVMGASAVVGVNWQPTPSWGLGLSLHSPAISMYESNRVSTVATNTDATDPDAPDTEFTPTDRKESNMRMGVFTPARLRLGVAFRFHDSVFSWDGDVQNHVKNTRLHIDRRFVWNMRAGARASISANWALGGGVFTDRDAARTVNGAGPVHFYGATLGLQQIRVRRLAKSENAAQLTFANTFALRYAHGKGRITGIWITDDGGAEDSAAPFAVDEFAVHIGSALSF